MTSIIAILIVLILFGLIFIFRRERYFARKLKLYKQFLDELPFEAVVMDVDFRYIMISGEAVKDQEMRRWLIGKNEIEYWRDKRGMPEIGEKRLKILKRVVEERVASQFEEKIIDRQGNERFFVRSMKPVYDDEGKLSILLGFGFDFTETMIREKELERLNRELKRSNEDLANFAHVASHDLKAPLRSITSFLQLLQRRNKNRFDETDNEYLGFAQRSAAQLSNLIEALLNYSRIDKQTDTPKLIDLNRVMELTSSNLFSIITERNATIEFSHLPTLTAHDFHIKQIFQNLIQNGLKYNRSEKPVIKVSFFEKADKTIVFAVQDNGIGIAPEFHEKVFQVFRRLHTSVEFDGSGIGLAACKRIVDFYEGAIWLESALGQGTTLFFTLPLAKPYFEEKEKTLQKHSETHAP